MKKKTRLNSRNSGKAEELELGNSLLEAVIKTNSEAGLLQIRLLEIVKPNPEESGDLKQLFQSITRADDNDRKPRHAYMPIGYAELEVFFGIKISERNKWFTNERGKEELTLNIINPTFISTFNKGKTLRVQIRESIYPKDEWQADHANDKAKINPSTGQKIYYEGQYIFANPFVVVGEPKHKWLLGDPDYREKQTFETPNTMEFIKPKNVVLPKEGTFDELRELLDSI
jgi:hypothetical protein